MACIFSVPEALGKFLSPFAGAFQKLTNLSATALLTLICVLVVTYTEDLLWLLVIQQLLASIWPSSICVSIHINRILKDSFLLAMACGCYFCLFCRRLC